MPVRLYEYSHFSSLLSKVFFEVSESLKTYFPNARIEHIEPSTVG